MFVLTLAALSVVLPDGRRFHVVKSDEQAAAFIRTRVSDLANAAIAKKGAFSMSIGSGTTVAPLVDLTGKRLAAGFHNSAQPPQPPCFRSCKAA